MKNKLVSSVFALILLTIVVATYTVSFKLNLAQLESQKLAQNSSDTPNLIEFAGAKAGNISVVPVTVPTNSPGAPVQTTPIPRMFLAGGHSVDPISQIPTQSINDVVSSINGSTWNQLTNNSIWIPRSHHSLTYLGGLMFLMGGATPNVFAATEFNDVYSSIDGTNWTQVLANAPWAPRSHHNVVAHNGKLFIMGGSAIYTAPCCTRIYFNDVWSSVDGQNWISLGNAPWSGRDMYASVVFNNKIWVMGGGINIFQPMPTDDVWSSPDGINWTLEAVNVPWGSRYLHSATVFNGKIYVIGGIDQSLGMALNDVWSSSDGINWTLETPNTGWTLRYGHTSLVFDGYMWVIGGKYYTNTSSKVYTDVWKSGDGITWTQQVASIPGVNGDGFAGVVMP